jgi:NodT family efflux transporter outer membrane factor (OMF) lipoprotein
MRHFIPILAACGLMAGGCSHLAGPDYQRPDVPGVSAWTNPANTNEIASLRTDWWKEFGDNELTLLIEQAITNNYDLRVAAGRVERARALASVADSRRLPTLGLNAGASFELQESGPGPAQSSENYQLGAGVNWEIDIWGKLAKGARAAEAEIEASGADWRAAYLQIASEMARQYFRLRQLDELMRIYDLYIADSERILGIYEARAAESLISGDVVLRQRAELRRLERERQELTRDRLTVQNGIAALLGQPAGTLEIPPADLRDVVAEVEVPAGLPSDLLERRPDILAAEYRVLAAFNLAGQARLDRLPSIALTGNAGSVSGSFGDLLNQWVLGGGPVISIPLFDPGKKAQVAVREADVKIASDQYRATVVRAFQEVEDTLINLSSRSGQLTKAGDALNDLQKANAINQAKFEEGLLSQLEVLEDQRSRLQSEQVALDLFARRLNDLVVLYKALGGGWSRESISP